MLGLTRLRYVLAIWVVFFHYFQDNILADPSSPAILATFAREIGLLRVVLGADGNVFSRRHGHGSRDQTGGSGNQHVSACR